LRSADAHEYPGDADVDADRDADRERSDRDADADRERSNGDAAANAVCHYGGLVPCSSRRFARLSGPPDYGGVS
jgi:hypothetical protein